MEGKMQTDSQLEVVQPQGGPEVVLQGTEVPATPVTSPPTAAELLAKVDEAGAVLRALIVLTKKLPRDKALEPHQDPTRSLAQAQVHLQTGFMWLRKAINAPKEF